MPAQGMKISTHTSLAGRDTTTEGIEPPSLTFLLTRPSRDVTRAVQTGKLKIKFLLTRPSRDVTSDEGHNKLENRISTHTSLAGRDCTLPWKVNTSYISTHTSLAGRDINPIRPYVIP